MPLLYFYFVTTCIPSFFRAGTPKASVIFATKDGRMKKKFMCICNLDHVLTKVLYVQSVCSVCKQMLEGYGGLWWGLASRTITMPLTSSSIESKLPTGSWSDLGLRWPLVAIDIP